MIKKKIVLVHTDLRIYWAARIQHFFNLMDKSIFSLHVIELSDHGGNYNFDKRNELNEFWEILFVESRIADLRLSDIRDRLHQRLNQLSPDILIAGAIAFPSGANVLNYSIKNKIPIVIFDDARINDVPRNFFINWIKKQLYSHVDAIFCPAPTWNATYKFFGFNEEQIFYGVDVIDNLFFQKSNDDNWILEKAGKGFFLNIGRQIVKKNLLSLLKAYKNLSEKKDSLPNLLFVGDGDQRHLLEAFVGQNDLKSKVIFLPFLPQEKLRSIYKHCSVFILPSSFGETWGLVINEAMASGLPVIVSNKVGCAETLVKDGKNGFIFNLEEKFSLENKLLEFYELNESDKCKMSDYSRKIISNWDLNRFSSGLLDSIYYVQANNKKNESLFGKIISLFWKGRYNSI